MKMFRFLAVLISFMYAVPAYAECWSSSNYQLVDEFSRYFLMRDIDRIMALTYTKGGDPEKIAAFKETIQKNFERKHYGTTIGTAAQFGIELGPYAEQGKTYVPSLNAEGFLGVILEDKSYLLIPYGKEKNRGYCLLLPKELK